MIILGIDPGSRHTGYGVIECEGGRQQVVEYGVLNLDVTSDHSLRLKQIYDRLTKVIERCLPDESAIEMPVYGRNPQSMLKLGRAQAAAMLAVVNRQIPATHYTPKEVKKSVTGNGNATKEQVRYMIRSLLSIDDENDPHLDKLLLDASDALAVALCHSHRQAGTARRDNYKDWGAYLRANPDRIS
jgi:crossover junction endodeoxyribonuclease RuvC